jgi:superfamily I DNA/RNA helicase
MVEAKHNCIIILFSSTHQALLGEEALKARRIPHSVINAPREFKADCGIALRLQPDLKEAAAAALAAAAVVVESIRPYHCRWI